MDRSGMDYGWSKDGSGMDYNRSRNGSRMNSGCVRNGSGRERTGIEHRWIRKRIRDGVGMEQKRTRG
jgi:hypothetical protein